MKKRSFIDYIEDILESILKVEQFIEGVDYNTFIVDEKTLYAVRTALQIIGEASARIPRNIRDQHQEIPWKQIIAFRNRIVHEYFGVDVILVWKTIQHDLPALKPKIRKLLELYKE